MTFLWIYCAFIRVIQSLSQYQGKTLKIGARLACSSDNCDSFVGNPVCRQPMGGYDGMRVTFESFSVKSLWSIHSVDLNFCNLNEDFVSKIESNHSQQDSHYCNYNMPQVSLSLWYRFLFDFTFNQFKIADNYMYQVYSINWQTCFNCRTFIALSSFFAQKIEILTHNSNHYNHIDHFD